MPAIGLSLEAWLMRSISRSSQASEDMLIWERPSGKYNQYGSRSELSIPCIWSRLITMYGGNSHSSQTLTKTSPPEIAPTLKISNNFNPVCSTPAYPPYTDVNANITTAKSIGEGGVLWFYNQVRNKGTWDYKQLDKNYENFGNFNYGATGAAIGFSNQVLLRMAGFAQWRSGNRKPKDGWFFWNAPYGDDPNDQEWIKKGIDYNHAGCWK
jgi:hypothetical protein